MGWEVYHVLPARHKLNRAAAQLRALIDVTSPAIRPEVAKVRIRRDVAVAAEVALELAATVVEDHERVYVGLTSLAPQWPVLAEVDHLLISQRYQSTAAWTHYEAGGVVKRAGRPAAGHHRQPGLPAAEQ